MDAAASAAGIVLYAFTLLTRHRIQRNRNCQKFISRYNKIPVLLTPSTDNSFQLQ
jgi:hypothetical protein